jgi:hypothetical protein
MGLTLRQAAELSGASRSTIHRALKSGKLSGGRLEDGTWDIDPSELARVFPWDISEPVHGDAPGQEGNSLKEREAVLAVRVEMLEHQLERERDTVEDLRKRLDRAEDRILALSAPAPEPVGQVNRGEERPILGALAATEAERDRLHGIIQVLTTQQTKRRNWWPWKRS